MEPERRHDYLHNEKADHRLLLKRYDFVFSFVEEMNRVLGQVPVMMIFRKTLEKCGAPQRFLENVTIAAAGEFVDSLIVPVDIQNSIIPDAVSWDGKTRTLDFLGTTHWRVLPVSFIQKFQGGDLRDPHRKRDQGHPPGSNQEGRRRDGDPGAGNLPMEDR